MIFSAAPDIALQAAAPGLQVLALLISVPGSAEFYLAVIPLILWCYDRDLGVRLLLLCSASGAINSTLKLLFHAPRPYWISSGVKAFASEPTFGMPSAAAQVSLTFLGCIGARFRQAKAWAGIVVLVLLVGIARMYLGVHFPGDVLTGWIFAIVILVVFLRYESPAAAWLRTRTVPARILLALCGSGAMILASWMVIAGLGAWQVPAAWSAQAFAQTQVPINPLSLKDTLSAAGLFFGAAAGAVPGGGTVPGDSGPGLRRNALRILAGGLVLAALWAGLGDLTRSPDLTGPAVTWIRAALAGVWITGGAPVLFRKTGI